MTQQDYLVPGDTTLSCAAPPHSIIFNTSEDAKEIAKFTEEGFYYKGEFVDDAGEVHRLLKGSAESNEGRANRLVTCFSSHDQKRLQT
jgi:hypothetical protein